MPIARRLAVVVAAVQTLVLVGAAGWVLVELALGRSSSAGTAVAEAVLSLVLAAGLAALAVAWRRSPDRARTPALVWHVLLVPVVVSLFQSAQPALGWALGVVALVGLVSAGLGGGSEADADGVAERRDDEAEGH